MSLTSEVKKAALAEKAIIDDVRQRVTQGERETVNQDLDSLTKVESADKGD